MGIGGQFSHDGGCNLGFVVPTWNQIGPGGSKIVSNIASKLIYVYFSTLDPSKCLSYTKLNKLKIYYSFMKT